MISPTSQTPDKRLRLLTLLLILFVSSSAPTLAQQAPDLTGKRLTKIEVTGLQRNKPEEIIAISGLRTGQAVSIADLDNAAERLMQTGLFSDLTYSLRGTGEQLTVTFKVVEVKGGQIPVIFDNFVWFSDEELAAAVRRHLPSFDGTAPETNGAVQSITKALEQLLAERKLPGQVEYVPLADESGRNPEHIFSVRGVDIPVCSLHFTGASAIEESELVKNSKALFENPYSRKFAASFINSNLGPLYRERGHLRIKFREPDAKLESGAGCKGGVGVSVGVEEGVAYSWDKSVWEGNRALTSQELEAALGMKAGELANGLKIDKGMTAAQRAYGRRGYLSARLRTEAVFDDAGRRVAYRFSVDEGPQYRMGTLNVTGLTDAEAARLKKRWTLATGEVYDAGYLDDFLKKEVGEFIKETVAATRGQGMRKFDLGADIKPDREKLTVDVTIKFR